MRTRFCHESRLLHGRTDDPIPMNIRFPILYLVLFLAVALVFFWNRASVQGRLVNTDVTRTDQGAYIEQGIEMRMSDFSCVNPRNRMPLYPGLLALFMDKRELGKMLDADSMPQSSVSEWFFPKGKRVNMVLTLLLAIFLAVVFFRAFPRHHALNVWMLAVFGVLVFKAPYTQAEILYYFLTFAAFLVCWRLFAHPGFLLAVLAGGLLGAAHLTKASVLPGVLVFAVFHPLDALWRWHRRKRTDRSLFRRLAVTVVLVGAFLAVIGPYILQSKRMFDRYFYNVNSTFYMWCDSWEEAKARTRAAGDRFHYPDLPPEELPGPGNYLRTHTLGETLWRPINGISLVFNSMMNSYGYLWPCLAYLGFAVLLAVIFWRLVGRLWRARPFVILALAAYFVGYYLLIAWYSPVIMGNRFILGLFLPFLFATSAVIVKLAPRLRWQWRGRPTHALTLFNGLMSLWLAVEVALTVFVRVGEMYGGS